MGKVVDLSQDLCSPYHVSSSDNPSLNRVCSLVTQQKRQIFGDQTKAMIATSKGGYKNNATTYGRGGVYGIGSYERGYTSKICSHYGKTGYTIDTCYKKHDFPPHFKFKNQNHDHGHTDVVFQNTNFNNNEQNHEGSKSEVESQQIGFTLEQYQTLLALLQQAKSSDNVSNQVSIIPFNMTTQTGNNFIYSFISWIIDSGAIDHICSSLTYLVVKLIDKLSCVLTFDSNGYHIQNKNSLKMIGSAKMQYRVYILKILSYQTLQIKPIKSTHPINIVNVSVSDPETL